MDGNHNKLRIFCVVMALVSLAAVFGWLTARQGGVGVPLATMSGSTLLAIMFLFSGLGAASLVKCDLNFLPRSAICVSFVCLISAVFVLLEGGGLGQWNSMTSNFILFVVLFLIQNFLVSIFRPILRSKLNRFTILHLLYVTAGIALIATLFQLAGEISLFVIIGVLYGCVTTASIFAVQRRSRYSIGAPALLLTLIGSIFAPRLLGDNFIWSPIHMGIETLGVGVLTCACLLLMPSHFIPVKEPASELAK